MCRWLNPFLATCVAVLGVAVLVLEHRISSLESELKAVSSGVHFAASGVAVPAEVAHPPHLNRRPAGEINGIPYYHLSLGPATR